MSYQVTPGNSADYLPSLKPFERNIKLKNIFSKSKNKNDQQSSEQFNRHEHQAGRGFLCWSTSLSGWCSKKRISMNRPFQYHPTVKESVLSFFCAHKIVITVIVSAVFGFGMVMLLAGGK